MTAKKRVEWSIALHSTHSRSISCFLSYLWPHLEHSSGILKLSFFEYPALSLQGYAFSVLRTVKITFYCYQYYLPKYFFYLLLFLSIFNLEHQENKIDIFYHPNNLKQCLTTCIIKHLEHFCCETQDYISHLIHFM